VQYEYDRTYPRDHRAERDGSGLCTAHAIVTHIAVDSQFVAGSAPTAVGESDVAGHAKHQSVGISDATESESASEGVEGKGGVRGPQLRTPRHSWG
jgi:hypothetical protein